MKSFRYVAAQGDMMLIRVDSIPESTKLIGPTEGRYVLAHSETGHDHVVLERPGVRVYSAMDDFKAMLDGSATAYLEVEDEAELKHLRSFDTHESIVIPAGRYEVRRQREYTPEGFRRAAD